MAENFEKAGSQSSPHNITCSLCLDIFDDATVLPSCGHTFCRKCLKEVDLSHQDPNHMVCPLCIITTRLSANRIDDIHTNETINDLEDKFHGKGGKVHAVLERRPNCTACKLPRKAVSFCRTCTNYMCDKCLLCHEHLTSVFEGHEIISIQDIISGNVAVPHKCLIHKQENRDIFCEDCKVCVCFKCVVVDHRNHKIKNCVDFEQELRLKEKDLIERCATKKSELEKNIQDVETQRHEIHSVMQKMQEDVTQAYSIKAKRLEENQQILTEEIVALKLGFDEDLDALKSTIRQMLQNISSSMTLVANERSDHLDADSLSAHTLLCEELDCMLKEATDYTSAVIIAKKAQKRRFVHAGDSRLHLGNISEDDHESKQDNTDSTAAIRKKNLEQTTFIPAADTRLDRVNTAEAEHGPEQDNTSAHIYETVINTKAQKKMFKPADDTRLDQRNISAAGHGREETIYHTYATSDHGREETIYHTYATADHRREETLYHTYATVPPVPPKPELHVIRYVELRGTVDGMTKYSDDSVAIGYGLLPGIYVIDSAGDAQLYKNIPIETECFDLVFQQDRSLCISTGYEKVLIFTSRGKRKSTIRVEGKRIGYSKALKLNRGPSDEILVTHKHAKQVYIYDPKGSRLGQTLKTKHDAYQASATSSGLIVVSSCTINPSMVTVHDRDGKAGHSLQAPSGVYLYAAVDEQDRVYVASIDCMSGRVVIRLYDIDGLNLKERKQFNTLELQLPQLSLSYFVSLSSELLALASFKELYFIKISK